MTIKSYEASFLTLGHERNMLVHKNFSEYTLNKNTQEIEKLFDKSIIFFNFIESKIMQQDVGITC